MRSNIVKSIALLAVSSLFLAVAGTVPARAETLYAVDGFNANDTSLHILSPATGEVLETVGPIGFPNVTGIAFDPTTGVLYGVTSRFTLAPGGDLMGAELITIDLVTGSGTFVGIHDADIADIAFDSAGTLYAWVPVEGPFCCDALGAIDLSNGDLSLVWNADFATPGFDAGTGLAFDSSDNLFVKATTGEVAPGIIVPGNLFSVDASPSPTPGIFSDGVEPRPPLTTLSLSGPNHDNGLAFDANDTLYTIGRLPFFMSGQLLVIDRTTMVSNVAGVEPAPGFGLNSLVNISAIAFQPVTQVDIDIDIMPGTFPNELNLGSGGAIPVAVLGSAILDVNDIDIESLILASASTKTVGVTDRPLCSSTKDVSGDFSDGLEGAPDGFLDLVCHFLTVELGPEVVGTTTQVTLSGSLIDGTPIEGTDSVVIVP